MRSRREVAVRVSLLLVAIGFSAAIPGDIHSQSSPSRPVLAFQHVNIVDVRSGNIVRDQTVVVESGRLTEVGPAKSVKTPAGATIVDARSKFLIPGLWDMHVHAAWPGIDQQFAKLFVANGVTGVREMYGATYVIKAWKTKYQSGEAWPRMVGAGHILDGPRPFWPGSMVASNAAEGRAAVDSLKARGADFIKVYNGLPREAYVAALEEAKRIGTTVVGHVPDAVLVSEASDLGQRSIEHLNGVSLDCSHDADALRAERVAAEADTSVTKLAVYTKQVDRILATQDPARCTELMKRLARNRTWQVPTLTVLRSMAFLNDSTFAADERLRYMPGAMTARWDWRQDFRFRNRTPEAWANARRSYQRNLEIVGEMKRADVPILAGTDVLNPFCFPGFSLHDELGLLVEAGLSPHAALRAATLSPAMFLGATDSLGTVEKGKRADLVLLDANPLENIGNTRKINAVVLNGRLYDRAAIDSLLAAAEKSAGGN
jgi:imidazolonepropionase-like amidohydrolase